MGRFKCTQAVWSTIVCIMFVLNILFIIDLTFHHGDPRGQLQRLIKDGPHQGPPKFLSIKILSSRESASVAVDGKTVYSADSQRGMHIVVLNQMTGGVMASRVFDTYTPGGDEGLPAFLQSIADGRILCFAILDEATFSLKDDARNAIAKLDSQLIKTIKWRYTWAFVTIKGKGSVGEDIGRSVSLSIWGTPVNLHVTVPLLAEDSVQCKWPQTQNFIRRRSFCSKYEGYKDICDCSNPLILSQGVPLSSNEVANIPVTIIASNRPQYLFRMLKTLLSTPGSNASYTTVYIDGFFQEPADVAYLFGVRAIKHEPLSQKNGRIAQHYKASLTKTFESYPNAKYTIVLEEDLDVAPDFFRYFSQTKHLLEHDSSLYCISAWNDQGYDHSCQDPSALYRVETMPGLGWLLSRTLYKEELEPQWPSPDKLWDWDMWMRTDFMRKGRECVIPDVSRTYHFGASGLNMNPYFQTAYFKKHSLNKDPNAVLRNVDRLKKDLYEEDVKKLIASAKVLDHSKDPCQKDFVPNTKDNTYIMFMVMEKRHDYGTWMQLAKCFHLWDLDARGFHKGLWRFWLKGNHILLMGVPYSPYKGYMPSNIVPIKKEKKEKHKRSKRKA